MKIVILASGAGSLAQAIFDSVSAGELSVEIIGVISDQPAAPVLDRAVQLGIKTFVVPMKPERLQWDRELFAVAQSLNPDLMVSAGFMRILAPDFVRRFRIINSHPALLPNFPGAHAVRDALTAGVSRTGTTMHWVDEGVDTGEVIAQVAVDILPSDTEESLHERIKIQERGLIVATIRTLIPIYSQSLESEK
ncbi:MAG: phosphoribosylglycinamide formyltransferase [Actinomycetes bacterium]